MCLWNRGCPGGGGTKLQPPGGSFMEQPFTPRTFTCVTIVLDYCSLIIIVVLYSFVVL